MSKQKNWRRFETNIYSCCIKYRKNNLAIIQQISTPVVAGIMQKSTIDFLGCYNKNGYAIPIAIEAKTTKSKSSLSLSNIRDHQILFLNLWLQVGIGAEAYFFIQFNELQKENEFFQVPAEFIITHYRNQYKGGPKSIKFNQFKSRWIYNTSDFLNLLTKETL